ncbi:MAG: hypothetical protein JWO44_2428 [Bacteroidetes bacterium]|nr:hypothetical protein [Bacteroidota bacterium]
MKKTVLILCTALAALNATARPDLIHKKRTAPSLNFEKKHLILSEDGEKEQLKGRFIINAGAGFNLFATSLTLKYAFRYNINTNAATAGPVFHAGCDFGILKNLSVGVDAGYQTAQIGLEYYDENGNYYLYMDKWKRYYVTARADYHIIAKNNVSLYTGLRIGFNMYSVTPAAAPYQYYYYSPRELNLATGITQAHIGFCYFFKGIVGANVEVGLGYGGPFIGSAGLSFKI